MKPDDLLNPRVRGEVRFESGEDIEVSARPRKHGGFVDQTMVALRRTGTRNTAGVQVRLLKQFVHLASSALDGNPDLGLAMGVRIPITPNDASAILGWLEKEERNAAASREG